MTVETVTGAWAAGGWGAPGTHGVLLEPCRWVGAWAPSQWGAPEHPLGAPGSRGMPLAPSRWGGAWRLWDAPGSLSVRLGARGYFKKISLCPCFFMDEIPTK